MTIPKIQYVMDSDGRRTFVQLSVEDWERLKAQLERMRVQKRLRSKFRAAFKEMRAIQRGEVQGQTLGAFLDEL